MGVLPVDGLRREALVGAPEQHEVRARREPGRQHRPVRRPGDAAHRSGPGEAPHRARARARHLDDRQLARVVAVHRDGVGPRRPRDAAGVGREHRRRADQRAVLRPPDLQRARAVDGGQAGAVGGPAHAGGAERAAVAGETAHRGERVGGPEGEAAVVGADGHAAAVGRPGQRRRRGLLGAVAVLGLRPPGEAVPDPQRRGRPQPAAHDRGDVHAVRGHRRLVEVPDALDGVQGEPGAERRQQHDRDAHQRQAVAPPGPRRPHSGGGEQLEAGEQVRVTGRVRAGGNRDRDPLRQLAHRLRQVVRVGCRRAVHQHRDGRDPGPQCRLDLDPHRVAHEHQPSAAGAVGAGGPVRADHDADDVAAPDRVPDLVAQRGPPADGGRPDHDRAAAVPAAQRRDDAGGLGRRVGPPVAQVDPWAAAQQAPAVQQHHHETREQGGGEPARRAGVAGEEHHEQRDVERARPEERACGTHGATRRRCRCRGLDVE